jgi:hypothetical protein
VPGRECAHVGSIQTDREGAGSMWRTRALDQGGVCVWRSKSLPEQSLFGLQAEEKEESEKNHADALEQHTCDVQQLPHDGDAGGVDARGG